MDCTENTIPDVQLLLTGGKAYVNVACVATGINHTENTIPLLLFTEPILCNDRCFAAVACQQVYGPLSSLKAIHSKYPTGIPPFLFF
jgi:hypothetical protein